MPLFFFIFCFYALHEFCSDFWYNFTLCTRRLNTKRRENKELSHWFWEKQLILRFFTVEKRKLTLLINFSYKILECSTTDKFQPKKLSITINRLFKLPFKNILVAKRNLRKINNITRRSPSHWHNPNCLVYQHIYSIHFPLSLSIPIHRHTTTNTATARTLIRRWPRNKRSAILRFPSSLCGEIFYMKTRSLPFAGTRNISMQVVSHYFLGKNTKN